MPTDDADREHEDGGGTEVMEEVMPPRDGYDRESSGGINLTSPRPVSPGDAGGGDASLLGSPSGTEPEVERDLRVERQLQPASPKVESQGVAGPELESDLENQPGLEPESEPEPQPDYLLEPRSESEPDIDPEPVSDSKPRPEPNDELEFEALSQSQPEPQLEHQAEIQSETQFKPEPQQLETELGDDIDLGSNVGSSSTVDSDMVTVIYATSNRGDDADSAGSPVPSTNSVEDDVILSDADSTPSSNPDVESAADADIPTNGDATTDSAELGGLDEASVLSTTETSHIAADIVQELNADSGGIFDRDEEDYFNRVIDSIEDTTSVEATPLPTTLSTEDDILGAVDTINTFDIGSGAAIDVEAIDEGNPSAGLVPISHSDETALNATDKVIGANFDVGSTGNPTENASPVESLTSHSTLDHDAPAAPNHNPSPSPIINERPSSSAKSPPQYNIGFFKAPERINKGRPKSRGEQGREQKRKQYNGAEVKQEEILSGKDEVELEPYEERRQAKVIERELSAKQKVKLEETAPGQQGVERRIKPKIGRKRSLEVRPDLGSQRDQNQDRKPEPIPRPIAKPKKRHIPDAIYTSAMKQSRLFADIQQEITELYHSPRTNNESAESKHNNGDSKATTYDTISSKHYGGGNKGSCEEDDFYDVGDVKDTCPACQTHYSQALDSVPFRTSLNLRHNNPWSQTWGLGDRYIITETSEDNQPELSEHVTLAEVARLLRDNTRVPVPMVLAAWKETGGKVITITEKPPGRRLFDVWWEITGKERKELAREVGGYVEQWRWNYSDAISGVGGGPIHGRQKLLGGADDDTLRSQWRSGGGGFPPCFSDAGFWGVIEGRLRRGRNKNEIDEKTLQFLNEWMPESYPCRLTHGDLSTRNIMVEIGNSDNYGDRLGRRKIRVTAILGFENAASLPTWAEGVCNRFCYCREDEQWKEMLSKHIPSDPLAFDWWRLWVDVDNKTVRPDPARLRMHKERCRRWPKPPAVRRPFVMPRVQRPQEPDMLLQESAKAAVDADRQTATDLPQDKPYTEIEDCGPEEADVDPGPSLYNIEPINFWDTEPVISGDESDDVCVDSDDESIRKVIVADDLSGEGQAERQPLARDLELEKQKFEEVQRQLGAQLARLRGRYNTWYAHRAAEGEKTPDIAVDSNEFGQREAQESIPRAELRSKSPNEPLDITAGSEIEQLMRGRPRDRKPPEERSSESSSRRMPMRSFTQKNLQPLTLRTLPRPKSSPVILASDMEKLRDLGEDEREAITDLQLSGERQEGTTKKEEPHVNDSLPTIQEIPATPRRPVPLVKRRSRPASLYGALYAMGQRQRRTLSVSAAENGQTHRRSHSFNLPLGTPSEPDRPHPETRASSAEPARTYYDAEIDP